MPDLVASLRWLAAQPQPPEYVAGPALYEKAAAKIESDAKVIAALREAIRWALGEVADDKGQWFGDNRGADAEKARKAPYWWRTNLRRISGVDEQTAGEKL